MLGSKIKILGATVHVVDEGIDTGPAIIQAAFPNQGKENLEKALKLYRWVQDILYVQALRYVLQMKNAGYPIGESHDGVIFHKGVMFVPSIDKDILQVFKC